MSIAQLDRHQIKMSHALLKVAFFYSATKIFGACTLVLKDFIVLNVLAGSSPVFVCRVGLNETKPHILKWYKDDIEICRYTHLGDPSVQIFPNPEPFIEEITCGNSTIGFKQIPLSASGMYKCEASTESKNQKVMSSRNMSVMVYPAAEPEISGVMPDYRDGEIITANCTASPSNPPPKLSWFINGILADKYMIHQYTEAVNPGGLYKRALGLKLLAREELFSGPGGIAILTCMVVLPGLPPWKAMATPKLVLPPTLLPVQSDNTTEIMNDLTTMNNQGTQVKMLSNIVVIVLWQNYIIST